LAGSRQSTTAARQHPLNTAASQRPLNAAVRQSESKKAKRRTRGQFQACAALFYTSVNNQKRLIIINYWI